VIVYCASANDSSSKSKTKLLSLKVLVANHSAGTCKLIVKSPLLTLQGNESRLKVASDDNPRVIELNGKEVSESTAQSTLEQNQFCVMKISFSLDHEFEESNIQSELDHLSFLEVPVKIEGKGVVKVKANLQQSTGNNQ